MELTVKTKIILLHSTWMIAGCILGLFSLYVTEYFLIPLIGTLLAVGTLAMSVKCSQCGKPVLKNEVKIFKWRIPAWTSWFPEYCPKCHNKLR